MAYLLLHSVFICFMVPPSVCCPLTRNVCVTSSFPCHYLDVIPNFILCSGLNFFATSWISAVAEKSCMYNLQFFYAFDISQMKFCKFINNRVISWDLLFNSWKHLQQRYWREKCGVCFFLFPKLRNAKITINKSLFHCYHYKIQFKYCRNVWCNPRMLSHVLALTIVLQTNFSKKICADFTAGSITGIVIGK